MKSFVPRLMIPPQLRRLVLAPFCVSALIAVASAQTAQTASPTAAQLAKYDANRNGRLDADELAAMQSDQAKAAARTPVETIAAGKDKVVELTPFEVDGSDDKGYFASSTMAGTRLNSKLEDIGSSVSVVTKQQLLDTAAVDLNDIFLYEVGTEGTGQYTDLTNDGRGDYDNVQGSPTSANRMRGLSQANIAVGGFTASSSIPIDTYNVSSVEISRGPNSNLAGLSDAGGTVNLVTSGANLTRESTNVTTRADSYGGFRTSIDLNRPIFRDKFALRFSAVYNEQGFVRKPSVDRTNRQQLALTYRPFKGTRINGSIESFHEWAQRANSISPRDSITVWKSRGSPTWDPITQTSTVNGVTTSGMATGISGIGSSNVRILQYIDGGTIQFMMKGANINNAAFGLSSGQQFTQSSSESAAGPLYKIAGTTNKAIYDWTDINLAASGYEIQSARIANVSLEQAILHTRRHDLDLQLAWRREDQQDYRRMFIAQQDGVGNTLQVDTNQRLLDGRPNPFFLRPFIGGVNPQVNRRPVFNDNYRWQLAYQLNFRQEKNRYLRWLGLHRAVTYQEAVLNIQSPNSLRYHDIVLDNPDFQPGLNTLTPTSNLTGNAGALFYPLYYFGDKPGGGVTYANTGPVNPNGVYKASFFRTTTGQWDYADPVTIKEVYFAIGSQKKKIRSSGINLQSYLLNDQVVTTFGVREDRVYTEDNLPLNLTKGFYEEDNLYNFGVNKKYKQGKTRTKAVVVKPFRSFSFLERAAQERGPASYVAEAFRGLNLHYNRSDSFKPSDTAYNLFLQELPNPQGQTEEYGFSLNNLFGKFSLRLTHQETIQLRTRAGTGTIATRVLGMDFHPGGQNLSFNLYDAATNWQQQLHPQYTPQQAQEAAAKQIGYTSEYIASASGKSIADASDATSKGWELELQFNPTRYWTVKATGNQQEAVDSGISIFIQKFIDERLPYWTTVRVPTDPLPDGSQLTNAGSLWWTTQNGSNGAPVSYYTTNIEQPLNIAIATQGKKKPQTREYSLNLITSYQLAGLGSFVGERSWLRKVTVGGAYRWSSQGAIGYYGAAPDPDGVVRKLDRDKPFYDQATGSLDLNVSYRTKLYHDRVRASFQLNVRNATESGGLKGVAVNPDGKYWQYRIIDPRQFIFTASFDL